MNDGAGVGAFTALVLAGSRSADDPVAREAGVAFKALAPVAGVPMLTRVLQALRASPEVGRIVVCAPEDQAIAAMCQFAGSERIEPSASPARSVQAVLGNLAAAFPLLVTTADHPLLTPEMIAFFTAESRRSGADLTVALASRAVIRAAYPGAVRTFLPFRDDGFSGCNLFGLMNPAAVSAVRFWQRVEAERKRPWRLVRAFGLLPLVLFATRRLTLDRAMDLASRRLGITVRAVRMPFAEAAIDVDKPADRLLAERILAERVQANRIQPRPGSL